jgi:hypothetical protein
MNRLIFQGGKCKFFQSLGRSIISLIKYWSQIKGENCVDNIHQITPADLNNLPMQVLE